MGSGSGSGSGSNVDRHYLNYTVKNARNDCDLSPPSIPPTVGPPSIPPTTAAPTMPPTPTYACFSLSGFYSCVEHDSPDGSPSKEDCSRTCGPPLYRCTHGGQCEAVTSGSSGLSLEECKRVCHKAPASLFVAEERL